MFFLIENGQIIAEESDFGNAAELAMVLEEMHESRIIIKEEGEFYDELAEIHEMQIAAEQGIKLF